MLLARQSPPKRQHGSPSTRRKPSQDVRAAAEQRRPYGTVPFAAVASPTAQRRLDVAARCAPLGEAPPADAELHRRAPAGPAQTTAPLEVSADAAEQGALLMAAAAVPTPTADIAAAARQSLQTFGAGDSTQNRSAPAAAVRQLAALGAKAAAFLDDRQRTSAVGARRPASKASARAAPAVLPVPSAARRAAQPPQMTAPSSNEHRCCSSRVHLQDSHFLRPPLHVACMNGATMVE